MIQQGAVATDSLRRTLDRVFAGTEYRWVEVPHPFAWLSRWHDALRLWLRRWSAECPRCVDTLSVVLLLILLAILLHAILVFVRTVRAARETGPGAPAGALGRDRAWYRREADRLAAAGQYVEAMQADFLALILALDGQQLVRFHASKTPAEYLGEANLSGSAREEFRDLVRSLYGYAFARWPCTAADFEAWRQRTSPERYARAH